ncbi:MAG TPA: GNAT family N-acetyltransferase [Friedmanniella sp.]
MDVHSLGLRTELALRGYAGSLVQDRGDHLVLRTPGNPSFWWGNCLVLPSPPADVEAARSWVAIFERELPDAEHRTFYVDGVEGTTADLDPFVPLGLTPEPSVVLTARAVHEPPRPNDAPTYRPLEDDADWAQQVELSMVGEEVGHDVEFCTRKAKDDRALADGGHGRWYGAFVDGQLVSSMGLFTASPGLARFQSVKTHPDHRGQGLAGTLTHVVGRFGLDDLGAETLVMVADPAYLAIRVYRSVGFRDTEVLLQAERKPEH